MDVLDIAGDVAARLPLDLRLALRYTSRYKVLPHGDFEWCVDWECTHCGREGAETLSNTQVQVSFNCDNCGHFLLLRHYQPVAGINDNLQVAKWGSWYLPEGAKQQWDGKCPRFSLLSTFDFFLQLDPRMLESVTKRALTAVLSASTTLPIELCQLICSFAHCKQPSRCNSCLAVLSQSDSKEDTSVAKTKVSKLSSKKALMKRTKPMAVGTIVRVCDSHECFGTVCAECPKYEWLCNGCNFCERVYCVDCVVFGGVLQMGWFDPGSDCHFGFYCTKEACEQMHRVQYDYYRREINSHF